MELVANVYQTHPHSSTAVRTLRLYGGAQIGEHNIGEHKVRQ